MDTGIRLNSARFSLPEPWRSLFGSELYSLLSVKELKTLSVVSYNISEEARLHILQRATFSISKESQIHLLKWYPPRSINRVLWLPSMHQNSTLIFDSFPSATHFTLSDKNTSPIGKLPLGIRQINFGNSFNHPTPDIPLHITHLTFGENFNQELLQLPSTLTHLVLGKSFRKTLPPLPTSIVHFSLTCPFNKCKLPSYPLPNLKYLNIQGTECNNPITPTLYPNITHLLLSYQCSLAQEFPPSITYLCFSDGFNGPIDNLLLPPSLIHLVFPLSGCFNHPISKLPPLLQHLALNNSFDNPITLPPLLTHLAFGDLFNQPLTLPLSLTHLCLGSRFNQSLSLPPSLTYLSTHNPDPSLFQNVSLSPSLTHLSAFNFALPLTSLPPSLTHLALGELLPINLTPSRSPSPPLSPPISPSPSLSLSIPRSIIYLSFPSLSSLPPISHSSEHVKLEFHANRDFWDPRPYVV